MWNSISARNDRIREPSHVPCLPMRRIKTHPAICSTNDVLLAIDPCAHFLPRQRSRHSGRQHATVPLARSLTPICNPSHF